MSLNYFNPFFSVKVMDGLFICNQTAVKDQQFILNNKFSLIVNTCPRQFKVLPIQNIYKSTNFHWVNSKNHLIESININSFKPIFQQITSNLQQGHGTLIVSQRGHSRAITFVLLYLMDKFQWQLYKALQYINSKRENLSVRATYLKLLVNYQKSHCITQRNIIKSGDLVKNNRIQQNEEISNHIKSSLKQKWSQQNIKSYHQKLITNTFMNTIKKRHINDINLQYRQRINKLIQNEKKCLNNINNRDKRNTNDNNIIIINKKRGNKSVQFSNQIQIIIGESLVAHNFPQYGQLVVGEMQGMRCERRGNFGLRENNTKQQRGFYSSNQINSKSNRLISQSSSTLVRVPQTILQSQSQQELQKQCLSKKELSSNSRLINIKKMQQQQQQQLQKKSNNIQQQKQSTITNCINYNNYHHQVIQLNQNDIYDNQFFVQQEQQYNDNCSQQQITINNISNIQQQPQSQSQSSSLLLLNKLNTNTNNNNQYLPLDSFIQLSTKYNQHTKSINIKSKEKSENIQKITTKSNQQNIYKKNRLSSYKKLKATILENQIKHNISPHQRQKTQTQHKRQRTQTQPKYDLEINHQIHHHQKHQQQQSYGIKYQLINGIQQQKQSRFNPKPIDRRLSSSENTTAFNIDHSQHRKSLSSAMGMNKIGRIDKISSSNSKQKRCHTPQLGVSQSLLINNQSLMSHNNIMGRPLSRGKSNSVRINKKTDSSPIMAENKQQKLNSNNNNNIFNVNINVNIGRLQMFGNMSNGHQLSLKGNLVNKEKLFKNQSMLDKIGLINSRPRSNSSNENYSKFSLSTGINNHEQIKDGTERNKFLHKVNGIKINNGDKTPYTKSYHNSKNLSTFNSSVYSIDQLNIGSTQSFSKQEIINKINQKLIQNHQNQTMTAKQNNFM